MDPFCAGAASSLFGFSHFSGSIEVFIFTYVSRIGSSRNWNRNRNWNNELELELEQELKPESRIGIG
jgi:hypothetical protein